jgi:hypothetical protein
VMMEGGWQYTHGGIDYALDPATAPNRHPGMLAGGPVLSGLQVLTLRRHGFVSLGTGNGDDVGQWVTKPLVLPSCPSSTADGLQLVLNAECGVDGFVAPSFTIVGATTAGGAAGGKEAVKAVPLVGNELEHVVEWRLNEAGGGEYSTNTTSTVPAPPGVTITMTITMRLADLYAFTFRCGGHEV